MEFVCEDWKHASYGTKIERAVEIRDTDGELKIVGEELLKTGLMAVESR